MAASDESLGPRPGRAVRLQLARGAGGGGGLQLAGGWRAAAGRAAALRTNLGNALLALGRRAEAAAAFRTVPRSPRGRGALRSLNSRGL